MGVEAFTFSFDCREPGRHASLDTGMTTLPGPRRGPEISAGKAVVLQLVSLNDLGVTTLFLTVGLPGAGKTTRARQLAKEHNALRLTPDEWMIPLFGEPEADGKRDVLEGRLLWLGLEALRLGTNVVLDFGCWSRDERSAIRWLVESVGASCHLVYVPVDHQTQRARIARRQSTTPDQTFPMSEADLSHWRTLFEEPDAPELDGHEVGGPPPGWSGWWEWAADRWPSFA